MNITIVSLHIQDSLKLDKIRFVCHSVSRLRRRNIKTKLEEKIKTDMSPEFFWKMLIFSACMSLIAPVLSHDVVSQFLNGIYNAVNVFIIYMQKFNFANAFVIVDFFYIKQNA